MRPKYVSPALLRLFGSLGFVIFGLGSMHLGNKIFNLGLELWSPPFSGWGGKGLVLIVISLVFAFVGMFFGWGIGASIKIRNQKIEDIINALWHYGANGVVIWCLFSGAILSLVVGREEAKAFIESAGGIRLYFLIGGIGLIGSWLIWLMLSLTGRIIVSGNEAGYFLARLLPIIVGLGMAMIQYKILNIPVFLGLISGFILPFILIPISASFIRRDEQARSTMFD